MRLLIDTHSFLWFIMGDERLSGNARNLIADLNNTVLVSAGTLWEIAIEVGLGKLTLSLPYQELIPAQLKQNQIDIVPIRHNDLSTLIKLPLHHRDPFDRLIIVQAINEDARLVTRDRAFEYYSVKTVW